MNISGGVTYLPITKSILENNCLVNIKHLRKYLYELDFYCF